MDKITFKNNAAKFIQSRYPKFPIGVSNDDYYISCDVSKYKGAKILVIGGGPTTNSVEWSEHNYDFLFSCNHFFLHPRLSQLKIDFVCTGPEVKHNNQEFLKYWDKYQSTICVANHDIKISETNFLQQHNKNKVCVAELRVKFKIGMGGHLLTLAALFEPAQLDFVGIDGYPKDIKNGDVSLHSFENNKKKTGTMDTYQKLFDHHQRLWTYLKSLNVPITNLGHGHPYNIFTNCT